MSQKFDEKLQAAGDDHPHPIDPLTTAEIVEATRILRDTHDLGPGMRFETIELMEPPFDAQRDLAAGQSCPRRAFIVTYDTKSGRLFEAVVSLDDANVESWVNRPGAQPRIGPDEFLEAERIALADPRFLAGLKRRGITDLSLVCADPWSVGRSGLPGEDEHRLVQTIVWVRKHPHDNPFAHPVENLCAIIDINSGKVLSVDDSGSGEVPAEEGNYAAEFQDTWRSGLKPIEVVQPEGPSFVVAGHAVEWCGWRFRIGFTAREGLVLHDLEIRDGETWRSVIRRASVVEMIVPYGSPYGLHRRKNAFDCGEYGIGAMANSLKLGCDCLGAVRYFDGVLNGIDGQPFVIENGICLHEEDAGILWKHTDFRTGETDLRRGRRLVISFIATVGNYEYAFYWYLTLDGTISLEIKATGIINTAGIEPPEAVRYGLAVLPGVVGQVHQHLFCARLVMAVDGPDNAVLEVDTELEPEGPDNPVGNAFRAVETLLESELTARRNVNAETNRYWKIVNRAKQDRFGRACGYRLMPVSCITALGSERSQLGMRAGFTRHHLWVTPTSDAERWPAGDYVNQSRPGEGLPRWTEADRQIVDQPLTVWHTFGLHHMPRPEDFPVQPAVSCSMMLMPDGFFARNPTLDVPPQTSTKSCRV
jgi:primary-amine oxidase